jgi:hypothetical protein
MIMGSPVKEKKIRDLTVSEFKHLMQESIAEDIEAWRETFEIMADKAVMQQIERAEKARVKGRKSDFIPGGKVKHKA